MTTTTTTRGSAVSEDAFFDCLASRYRRRLLGVVQERDSVTREELASALTARTDGTGTLQTTDGEYGQSEVALHHLHLPKLDAAGLIDYDENAGTVAPATHPALQDPSIQTILEEEAGDSQALDTLFGALADTRRRTVLDLLSHQYQPIHVETLAREVLAREQNVSERDVTDEAVDELLVSLHHSQLPALREAGIVEYDAETRRVTYEGHPELRVSWMHSYLGPDFRTSLTDSPADAAVGNVEGRENVVSYGQSLVETADDELFMMFTTTGLLEAGCFTRIEQAAERGVDVYLGTRDPTVREYIQEKTPSVTLWEPETNWLDLPVEEDNIGRLVFADREAVMVGTLGEKNGDGVHEEQAIVGDGADNTLVVLMRQMLRTRLEQFAEEDEVTESQIQF